MVSCLAVSFLPQVVLDLLKWAQLRGDIGGFKEFKLYKGLKSGPIQGTLETTREILVAVCNLVASLLAFCYIV